MFKHKTIFASKIKKVSNPEMETYLSVASLEKLKSLMPKSINLNKNPDLIGIVANAAVAGKRNLNGDSIANKDAIEMAKGFVWKFVDIEHKRSLVKGVICNYGFSKFGTNEIMTEEEVLKSEEPINISLALVLWKETLHDDFIELLEESVDETNPNYGSLSLSWELMFNNYDIAVGSTEVSKARIVTDDEEKAKLKPHLKCKGGAGKNEEGFIYRVISLKEDGDFLISSGVGIVEDPAGNVKGLYVIEESEESEGVEKSKKSDKFEKFKKSENPKKSEDEDKDEEDEDEEDESDEEDKEEEGEDESEEKASVVSESANLDKNSQDYKNLSVTDNTRIQYMKIKSIKDITNEMLKTADASVIHDFLEESFREADVKWKEEKNKLDKNIEDSKVLASQAEADKKKVEELLKTTQEKLEAIEKSIAEKQEQETFNLRMEALDKTYSLNGEENKEFRSIIAKEIFGLSDENYKVWETKASVLFKEKSLAYKQEIEDKLKEATAKTKEEVKASTVVTEDEKKEGEKALENAEVSKGALPNSTTTVKPTLKEKWAKLVADEHVEFVSRRK